MKTPLSFSSCILVIAVAVSFSQYSFADVVTQTIALGADNSDDPFQGSGSLQLVDNEFFVLQADPFDSSLGTLDSFTVSFTDFTFLATGVVGSEGGSTTGSISVSDASGPYTFNGSQLSGAGTGGGGGGATGNPIIVSGGFPDFSRSFDVVDSGTAFDPLILAGVEGSIPFDIVFGTPIEFSVTNVNNVVAETTGTITLQYNFTAVPEPSGALMAMLGCLAMVGSRRRKNVICQQ